MGKKILGYEILTSFHIGNKNVVLAKNESAPADEVFLCGYLETGYGGEYLKDCLVSDNYADIASELGERITAESQKVLAELEAMRKDIGDTPEISYSDREKYEPIESKDSLVGKVVVLSGSLLPHEYKSAAYQLVLCTGGFGAQPEARGRQCYFIRLYNGEKGTCYRQDIIGVVPNNKLPVWAKDRMNKPYIKEVLNTPYNAKSIHISGSLKENILEETEL